MAEFAPQLPEDDDDGGPPPLVPHVAATNASASSSAHALSGGGSSALSAPAPPAEAGPDVSKMSAMELVRYVQQSEERRLIERRALKEAKKGKAAEEAEHKFWDTQPMLSFNAAPVDASTNAPIDPNEDVSLVKQEPYNMPPGFNWSELDILDPATGAELYKLLSDNYVEDDEAMFRFDYSCAFLQWALTPPGYLPSLHLGVRASASGKLMGVITAIPVRMCVNGSEREMVEINFLCVHKKLRTKVGVWAWAFREGVGLVCVCGGIAGCGLGLE